jgi:hypothetical protein
MLDGFDRDWTDAGARRVAYYTNIPPGRYTFRVQAANNDGVWNTARRGSAIRTAAALLSDHLVLSAVAIAPRPMLALLKRRLLRAEREFKAVLGRTQSHCARDSRHAGAGIRGNLSAARSAGRTLAA